MKGNTDMKKISDSSPSVNCSADSFTEYIQRELQPISEDKEAFYLSKRCHVSIDDAYEFIHARESFCTSYKTNAEFILSDLLAGISEHLKTSAKLSDKKISSLLYHSSLYRRSKGSEKNEFKNYFPTISSFADTSLEKEGDTYDA